MKGTLLVLTLLVTAELNFQTAEACPIFYDVALKLVSGFRAPLNNILTTLNATDAEKEAAGKIQDCYNEGGFQTKLYNTKALVDVSLSKECLKYGLEEAIKKLRNFFTLVGK